MRTCDKKSQNISILRGESPEREHGTITMQRTVKNKKGFKDKVEVFCLQAKWVVGEWRLFRFMGKCYFVILIVGRYNVSVMCHQLHLA